MPPQPGMCWPGMVAVPIGPFDPYPVAPSIEKTPPPTLAQAFSVASSIHRIRWTVDARKLKSTDREAVSPNFELMEGSNIYFKMVMKPRKTEDSRGGNSFKKAKNKGTVQLRIVTGLEENVRLFVKFRLSIGNGGDGRKQERPRGPVRHDFADKPLCGLPEGKDEWDFGKVVDEATQTFVVCL